jgi:hypothetical protein
MPVCPNTDWSGGRSSAVVDEPCEATCGETIPDRACGSAVTLWTPVVRLV